MLKTLKKQLKKTAMHVEPQETMFDLICGMELTPKEVKYTVSYRGETYYFCSETCKEHFVNNPGKYLG